MDGSSPHFNSSFPRRSIFPVRPLTSDLRPPASPRAQARAFTLPKQRARSAFTLMELLVVMGIISILLVAVIPVINSLSKSGGRKAAIGNLLGAIEQAHAQAVKDGQATYVVFPTFTKATQPTLDRYHYKSYAIFEDDPASPGTPKQLTNWKPLPVGVTLRSIGTGSLSALTNTTGVSPSFTPTFTPDSTATASFFCLKFNSNGEVESPPSPPGDVTLTVFEGYVNGSSEVVTGPKDGSGNPLALQSIRVARLTGRAVSAQ